MTEPTIYQMRTERSLNILAIMCRDLNSREKTMIEIGSYAGESTAVFAKYFKTVYAIDPWYVGQHLTEGSVVDKDVTMDAEVEARFDKAVAPFSNVHKLKAFDYNVADQFKDRSIDFIYLDAIHTEEEVKRQLRLWVPKLTLEGVMGGHDYSNQFPGVVRAVDSTIGQPDKIYTDYGFSWSKYIYKCW